MTNHKGLRKMTAGLFGLLSTALFVSLALLSYSSWPATYQKHEPRSIDDFLTSLVSPNTARAVATDEVLQRNLLDAVDLTAELTKRLALHFDTIPELQRVSENIENYRRTLPSSKTRKRQSLGDLFGGLGGLPSPNTSALNPDSSVMSALSSSIGSAFSGIGSSLSNDVGGAGFFLGMGLGAGAAQGLNLSTAARTMQVAAKVAADNGMMATGLNPTIQNAALGAAASLLGSANITNLLGSFSGGVDPHTLVFALATGIGNGTSAGLKLSPEAAAIQAPAGNTTQDIAGTFGFALTKSVASNIDVSRLTSGSSGLTSGLTKNIDIGKVAQGAAMGFVQGAGDAVNSMGGVQALINGTAKMPAEPLPGTTMVFNDSVGGAATGFGQGLGGQGTLVGVQLLSQVNVTALLDGLLGNNTNTNSSGTMGSPSNGSVVVKRHVLHNTAEMVRRQSQVSGGFTANNFNLSLIINANTISSVGQSLINALTCEGIGGLILVGRGLISSGTIKLDNVSSVNTTLIKEALPKGIIHFTSNGNTFDIDGTTVADNLDVDLVRAANGVSINGNTAVKFAVLLVLHVSIAFLVYLSLLPVVLSLEASRNLLVRLKMSHVLPKIMRWVDITWLYVMSPLAFFTLLFGSLAGGTAGHFRTAHGAVGLVTVFITFAASASHYLAKRISSDLLEEAIVFPSKPFRLLHPITIRTGTLQTLFALVIPTAFSGIVDLSGVTLCVTEMIPLEVGMGLGVGLSFLYIVASVLTSLTVWLSVRELRKETKDLKKDVDEEAWGKKSLKEKIQTVKREVHYDTYGDRVVASGQGRRVDGPMI